MGGEEEKEGMKRHYIKSRAPTEMLSEDARDRTLQVMSTRKQKKGVEACKYKESRRERHTSLISISRPLPLQKMLWRLINSAK